MAPSRLCLKEGTLFIILQIFHAANGHCNGILYIIKCLNSTFIAVIASGTYKAKNLFITRIIISQSVN